MTKITVMPAEAGIQCGHGCVLRPWIPAFAGMTTYNCRSLRSSHTPTASVMNT